MRFAIAIIALFSAFQSAKGDDPGARGAVDSTRSVESDGVWPTQRMIEGFLVRWADDSATEYGLNIEETRQFKQAVVEQWVPFIESRRDALQPLLNQYLETRLAPEPPEREAVQRWAGKLLPMFEEFRAQMTETNDRLRRIAGPEHEGRLNVEAVKLAAALGLLEAKVRSWQQGAFEVDEFWQPTERARRRAQLAADKAADSNDSTADSVQAPGAPLSRIEEELLRWDYYVRDLIGNYQLAATQREAARSILRECKQRAEAHELRYRARIRRLENDIHGVEKLTDVQEAEMRILFGPIDDLFGELQRRLGNLLTAVQNDMGPPGGSDLGPEEPAASDAGMTKVSGNTKPSH